MGSIACSPAMKDEYTRILQTFLQDVGFEPPQDDYNLAVEDQVREHFRKEGFSEQFMAGLKPIIQASAGIAMTAFGSTPFEVQCTIGIYTVYGIAIDDRAQEMKQDLKAFNTRLLSGKTQGNKLLQSFAHFLQSMCQIFGQFGGDMMIKDSLQFISSCYLEAEAATRLHYPADSPDFPRYLRLKTGVAETFAFMLFPEQEFPEEDCLGVYLPAICYIQPFLNYTNDIMSFYKEMLELDDGNFVHNVAKSRGVTPIEALRQLCSETTGVVQRLRSLSSGDSKMSRAMERLIQGYIVYHLSQPRYRLGELNLPRASL